MQNKAKDQPKLITNKVPQEAKRNKSWKVLQEQSKHHQTTIMQPKTSLNRSFCFLLPYEKYLKTEVNHLTLGVIGETAGDFGLKQSLSLRNRKTYDRSLRGFLLRDQRFSAGPAHALERPIKTSGSLGPR